MLKQVWGNEIVFSCIRNAQNVFATLDILQSKSTGNGRHFYEVNLMMRLVLQFHRTIRFLMHELESPKWHGTVMCVF
jgi:hypothetical protein